MREVSKTEIQIGDISKRTFNHLLKTWARGAFPNRTNVYDTFKILIAADRFELNVEDAIDRLYDLTFEEFQTLCKIIEELPSSASENVKNALGQRFVRTYMKTYVSPDDAIIKKRSIELLRLLKPTKLSIEMERPNFDFNQLTKKLKESSQIKWDLKFTHKKLIDEELEEVLNNCQNIISISIQSHKITDKEISSLAQQGTLTAVSLVGCNKLTDASAIALSRSPSLAYVDLTLCRRMSDISAIELAKSKTLKVLNLAGILVSDAGAIALSMSSLTSLQLEGATITDGAGVALANNPNLESLTLVDCWDVGDVTAKALAGRESLHFLSLEGCSRITDEGAIALVGSRSLLSLNLSGCYRLTEATTTALKNNPYLYFNDRTLSSLDL